MIYSLGCFEKEQMSEKISLPPALWNFVDYNPPIDWELMDVTPLQNYFKCTADNCK
jgi:hypothetical protein